MKKILTTLIICIFLPYLLYSQDNEQSKLSDAKKIFGEAYNKINSLKNYKFKTKITIKEENDPEPIEYDSTGIVQNPDLLYTHTRGYGKMEMETYQKENNILQKDPADGKWKKPEEMGLKTTPEDKYKNPQEALKEIMDNSVRAEFIQDEQDTKAKQTVIKFDIDIKIVQDTFKRREGFEEKKVKIEDIKWDDAIFYCKVWITEDKLISKVFAELILNKIQKEIPDIEEILGNRKEKKDGETPKYKKIISTAEMILYNYDKASLSIPEDVMKKLGIQ